METCEIIWIESNEYKLFRTTHKKLQPMFFWSFFKGLEMPSKMAYSCTIIVENFT
jgi:hypothetical protein